MNILIVHDFGTLVKQTRKKATSLKHSLQRLLELANALYENLKTASIQVFLNKCLLGACHSNTIKKRKYRLKMAMKIGSKYDAEQVFPRHWEQLCNDIGYRYLAKERLIKDLARKILKSAY